MLDKNGCWFLEALSGYARWFPGSVWVAFGEDAGCRKVQMTSRSDAGIDRQTELQRFELLVRAIHDYAIYMLDVEGNIASWNAGAQRFKGYSASEIIGQHFSRFYTPEDQASGLPTRALNTARTAGTFQAEGWRVRKDTVLGKRGHRPHKRR